jgi:hypothetical protein
MEPVFCFVPDKALATFHHFISDFLAAVRGKTVQDACIRRGEFQE